MKYEIGIPSSQSFPDLEVMKSSDVCAWLGISEKMLNKLIREHGFPCKQVGTIVLFGRQSIIDWVNAPSS